MDIKTVTLVYKNKNHPWNRIQLEIIDYSYSEKAATVGSDELNNYISYLEQANANLLEMNARQADKVRELECVTENQKIIIERLESQIVQEKEAAKAAHDAWCVQQADIERLEAQVKEMVQFDLFSGECSHIWRENQDSIYRCLDNHKEPCTAANCPLIGGEG